MDINNVLNKKLVSKLVDLSYRKAGLKKTVIFADQLMYLGFDFSTRSGSSIGVNDFVIPDEKAKIIDTSEKLKIPFQRLASSRYTGTDTDAFAYSNGGVPSALISLPLRYMHTTVEMVHKEDVENVIRLIYESLLFIDPKKNFSYFD